MFQVVKLRAYLFHGSCKVRQGLLAKLKFYHACHMIYFSKLKTMAESESILSSQSMLSLNTYIAERFHSFNSARIALLSVADPSLNASQAEP
jgi:hypothetical protein